MGKMANFMFYLFCHNLKRTKSGRFLYVFPALPTPFLSNKFTFFYTLFFPVNFVA